MTLTTLITKLTELRAEYGNLPVHLKYAREEHPLTVLCWSRGRDEPFPQVDAVVIAPKSHFPGAE